MVDDYFIPSPTERKCHGALREFMNYMLHLGFICQKIKTSPPAQVQILQHKLRNVEVFCLTFKGLPNHGYLLPKFPGKFSGLS